MTNYKNSKGSDNKSNVLISSMIIFGTILIIFILFGYGRLLLNTSQKNAQIQEFKAENQKLENDIQQSEEKYLYLQSEQFKDKWAKERRSKRNPGEQVLILPPEIKDMFQHKLDMLSFQEQKIEIMKKRPQREQWWEFFFGERI